MSLYMDAYYVKSGTGVILSNTKKHCCNWTSLAFALYLAWW